VAQQAAEEEEPSNGNGIDIGNSTGCAAKLGVHEEVGNMAHNGSNGSIRESTAEIIVPLSAALDVVLSDGTKLPGPTAWDTSTVRWAGVLPDQAAEQARQQAYKTERRQRYSHRLDRDPDNSHSTAVALSVRAANDSAATPI
jgi:hypothetical protein